jgi:putative membrane protein
MFLWTKPLGLKTFHLKLDFAEKTKGLAANQGLYNGFLSAGLFWGFLHPDGGVGKQIQLFFLGCVVVAGFFGAATVNRRILVVQAVPALGAGVAVLLL